MDKEPSTIFRNADWVWEALIKQFELETGYTVAALEDRLGHILGEKFEDKDFKINLFSIEFKGVVFELDKG